MTLIKFKYFMNKYTLKYHSPFLEEKYLRDQMDFVLDNHAHVSIILLGLFSILAIFLFAIQTYSAAAAVSVIAFLDLVQYLYFRKTKSLACLAFISFINIALTLERFMYVYNPQMYSNTDQNAGFIMGLSFMTLHQTLLVDPRFWINSLVYIAITFSYCGSDTLFRSQFSAGLMPFLFCIAFQLYENFKQQKLKREKYLLQQKDSNKKSILCTVVEEPCCVFSFDHKQFNFVLEDSNKEFDLFFPKKSSITQKLNSIKILNQTNNLQQLCLFSLKEQSTKEIQRFNFQWNISPNQHRECQLYIERVGSPTFILIVSNKKKLQNIIKLSKKINQFLNIYCKHLIQQQFKKMNFVNSALMQIKNPKLYLTRKNEKINTLSKVINIEYIVQNNIRMTMRQDYHRQCKKQKVDSFNILDFVQQSIFLFDSKVRLKHSIPLQEQQIWSNKFTLYHFLITILSIITSHQSRVILEIQTLSDQFIFISKFPLKRNILDYLNFAAIKCNLKLLGPYDIIEYSQSDSIKISIYKDIRPLIE